jgi:hypothetical protein
VTDIRIGKIKTEETMVRQLRDGTIEFSFFCKYVTQRSAGPLAVAIMIVPARTSSPMADA